MKASEYFSELSAGAQIAAAWDITSEHADNNYRMMVMDANQGFINGAQYLEYRQRQDVEILLLKEAAGEKVRKKNGDFLWSKVCKNSSYRSNMSVISKQIDAGLPLLEEDGSPVPKNKMGKMQKEREEILAIPADTINDEDKVMARIVKDLTYLKRRVNNADISLSYLATIEETIADIQGDINEILRPF